MTRGQKIKQTMIAKLGSEEAYRQFMRDNQKRSHKPEKYIKSAQTKMDKDPLYFQKLGKRAAQSRKEKLKVV